MPENGLPTIEEQAAQQAEQEMYAADDAQNEQAAVMQQEESMMPEPQAPAHPDPFNYWNPGPRRDRRQRSYDQPATTGVDSRRTFYQSDYYPTPNNGTWTSPDGTFKLATYGQAPAAILGQRIQDVRLRKQQLAQVAQQFDPYAGIEAVKPQYAKDFNANTKELWDDFLATQTELHGSRREALKQIVTPGTEANWQWRDINRAQNTKGRYINYEVDRAAKNLTDMETGATRYDDKSARLSGEVLNALGSYQKGGVGNARKFEETARDYERRTQWVNYFKPLDERVKKFAIERLGPDGVQFDREGRMMVTSWDDLKYVTDYIDDIADQEWATGRWLKDFKNKEEFVKDLKDYYPISVHHNVRTNTIPYPPGSGSSQPTRPMIGNFEITEDAVVPKVGGHVGSVMSFPVRDKDMKPFTETFKVSAPGGKKRDMVLDRISVDKNGRVYLIGKDPTVTTTEVSAEDRASVRSLEESIKRVGTDIDLVKKGEAALAEGQTPEAALTDLIKKQDELIAKKSGIEKDIEKTTTKNTEEFPVPLDLNEAQVRLMFGDQYVDQVKKNAEAYKAQSASGTTSQQVPTTSGSPQAAPKTYAIGDRRTDKNGQEFEKVEGGWKALPYNSTSNTATPVAAQPKAATPAPTRPQASAAIEEEAKPVIHPPKVVRDTLTAKPMAPRKDGFEAMQDRVNQNNEPGIYNFKDQQQADSAFTAQNTPRTKDPRTATETDPKGFFKEGRIIKSDMGGKKVYSIVNKSGMAPLSDYFEDEESAKLVLDAFNRGEILEKFLSKRSRITQKEFEKLVNKK